MECKRRDLAVLATVAVAFFLFFNLRSLHRHASNEYDFFAQQSAALSSARKDGKERDDAFGNGAANETLGFGAIIAVSKSDSRRRQGLIDAANLTDLEIVIPEQPKWTDADVETVKDKSQSLISKGSAMAWLGHMNAVKWFLESNLTTALIVEDDVDWDIHIRHHQVPLVAAQLRALLAANPAAPRDDYAALRHHNRDPSYWGDLTQWEVLYLGHCGDNFDLKFWSDVPHNIFTDTSVPDMDKLHPDTMKWLLEAGLGQHERILHRSKNPLCTFAYAINRKSAERMMAELSHEEPGHGTWAFDVRLLEACRDLDWKCWTSNPELFHHQDEHDSAITEINGKPLFELHEQVGDGSTPNIACGARHAMFASRKDPKDVERMKQIAMNAETCSLADLPLQKQEQAKPVKTLKQDEENKNRGADSKPQDAKAEKPKRRMLTSWNGFY